MIILRLRFDSCVASTQQPNQSRLWHNRVDWPVRNYNHFATHCVHLAFHCHLNVMLLSAHPVTTLIQIPCQGCHTPAGRCKAGPVPEEGLEPVNEKTRKTEQPSSPGQILASLEPATAAAFVELLHTEYGFSDVQVARILEALQRTACSPRLSYKHP